MKGPGEGSGERKIPSGAERGEGFDSLVERVRTNDLGGGVIGKGNASNHRAEGSAAGGEAIFEAASAERNPGQFQEVAAQRGRKFGFLAC